MGRGASVKSSLFTIPLAILFLSGLVLVEESYSAGGSPESNVQSSSDKGTYNDRAVKGFDPANITCTDSDGNGWISQGECSWGDTSTPWFPNQAINTQQGAGVIQGGSGAALGQTATTTVSEPHFTVRYYNAPSAPGTTATSGVTSSPSASLREQHNEFGFEVVVDKKTDPLEPYYLKFYIPYATVDSTQVESTGDMTGNATGIYSKEITEMDPNNPGVFNRYTVTGTFTSTGGAYTSSSGCDVGCTSDEESQWRSQWP